MDWRSDRPARCWSLSASLIALAVTGVAGLPAVGDPRDLPSVAKPAETRREGQGEGKGKGTLEAPAPSEERKAAPASALVYVPPRRGTPRVLVAGGIRAAGATSAIPLALAPGNHVGQTAAASPSLFFHVDAFRKDENPEIVFTLIEANALSPTTEVRLPRPTVAGIQRIRLTDYEVELGLGAEYEWSVALVFDRSRRAHDRVATGYIQRVEPQGEAAGSTRSVASLARQGLFYDALEAASDAVDAAPESEFARARRKDLLEQAQVEIP